MKKTLFSAAMLCLPLVACTIEVKEDAAPTTTVAVTTTTVKATTTTEYVPPTTTYYDKTQLFLQYMEDETDLHFYLEDYQIIEIAEAVCDAAEAGMSGEAIINTILEASYQNNLDDSMIQDFAILAGAGVATFCPSYSDIFN